MQLSRVDINTVAKTICRKKTKKKSHDVSLSFTPFQMTKESQNEYLNKTLPLEDEFLTSTNIKFYPHQIQAIRWMFWTENININSITGGILGDVMGLGKTISGLGMILYSIFLSAGKNQSELPSLIVAPVTLMYHWKSEAINQAKIAEEFILEYHDVYRFAELDNKINSIKLVITTYETLQKDFEKSDNQFFKLKWARVFLDEAHLARNPKTKTFKALRQLGTRTKAVWCVTGTPIVNGTKDIRSLSLLCTPKKYLTVGATLQEEIWKEMHLLRRTKEMLNLPPMFQEDLWIEFTEEEAEYYKQSENKAKEKFMEWVSENTKQKEKILVTLMRLRQCCDHKLLREGYQFTTKLLNKIKKPLSCDLELMDLNKTVEANTENSQNVLQDLEEIQYSSKMKKLLSLINQIKDSDPSGKIVIFSQFLTMLDVVEYMLIKENIPCLRFDGRENRANVRGQIISQFLTSDQDNILLSSTKAGGIGINLVPAKYLVLLEPWWNSSVEYQAYDRIHRIGQTRQVYVYRILVKNSIEEIVLEIQKRKLRQESMFFEDEEKRTLTLKDILTIINIIQHRNRK